MPQTQANVAALQLEKVRKDFDILYERDDTFHALIKTKGEAEKVSSRDMRVPVQIRPGGKAGQVSMAGGNLGRGASTVYEKGVLTPLYFKFGVEIDKDVEYSTDSPEKAIAKVTKRNVKDGMAQFRAFLDKLSQGNGNGVLATVNAATPADPLDVDGDFGTQLFYTNQDISIFSPDFVTKRGVDVNVDAINSNTQLDLSALPSGTADNDVVTITGLAAGGGTSQSLFGREYHLSDAATGTWLGLNRANFPEVRTPSVNATTRALDLDMLRLALNKFILNLGRSGTPKDACFYVHPAQAHAYEKLGTAISNIYKREGANEKLDLLFGEQTIAGLATKVSINANPVRVDVFSPSSWGRAVIKEIDLYEVGGQTVFPIYNAAPGGLNAAEIFYFVTGFQYYVKNPRAAVFIKNLTKLTGY